jgi:hypothetical protein
VFIGGNLFNPLVKVNKKNVKNIYLLYIFFKKEDLKSFLTINHFVYNKPIWGKVMCLFLFTFFFCKTKIILNLSIFGIFGNLLQQSTFKKFFKNNLCYQSVLNKYIRLYILDTYNKYLFLQNHSIKFNLKSSNLLNIPKSTTSSIYKNISLFDSGNVEFQFLRKNKVYNKGRYSRCRQNYRTGVYLCMYLSIVSIFGLYYWFFKFSFNFSYLWWFFISFLGSFLLPKIIKYRLYEPSTTINSFYNFFIWLSLLFKSLKG